MESRERVRQFLLGGEADRPPFLPLATELTARLAQVEPTDLFSDPNLLTQSFIEVKTVCRFECLVFCAPGEAVLDAVGQGDPARQESLSVLREGVKRLRLLLGQGIALALLLPGPLTLTTLRGETHTGRELDDIAAKLLQIAQFLDPPMLDVLGIIESVTVPEEVTANLGESLSSYWNSATYYSTPSLFLAVEAEVAAASIGATAVGAWRGASPDDLLRAGATRVGVPVQPEPDPALPPRPDGGFYVTAGEIPADTDVAWVQALATHAAQGPSLPPPR